jgi:hypothetical protein
MIVGLVMVAVIFWLISLQGVVLHAKEMGGCMVTRVRHVVGADMQEGTTLI